MEDFPKFKPVCVDLLKAPTPQNLTKLRHLLEESDVDSISQLQEYILFPLYIITSSSPRRSEKVMTLIGECLQLVCQKSTLRVFKIFSDFTIQCLLLLHDITPSSESGHIQSSEELKLVAIRSVLALLTAASLEVVGELIAEQNKPLLGHFVLTLLKVVSNEEMKELRLTGLECLLRLSCSPVEALDQAVAGFFPGICTHMLKTINGAVKQSHLVTQMGVRVFDRFIVLVMNDRRFEDGLESDWLQKTRGNLHPILEKILNNPELHWKVKLEIISAVKRMVEECSLSLEPSLSLLIKKLVQFTVDERHEVQAAAKEAVQVLSESHRNFDSAVRRNLYDIVTCLPRIITQGISRDQSLILQELQGHLILLGKRLEHTLIFSGLRQRLFKGILLSAAVEPAKVMEGDEPYNLKYLRDKAVVDTFASCCSSVSRCGATADAVDFLLEVVRQNDSLVSESVYVMFYIARGADAESASLVAVLQEYSTRLTQLTDCKSDVIQGHLMLRVIGEIAVKMRGNFTPLLLTVLRPVLEKAGHPASTSTGVMTLQSIAEALTLPSVSQLLEENIDYFAPQLSFQLRNIERYPRAIDLLRALLLLSEIRMDQWLERMVHQALKGLDRSHTVRALPYAQVLELYCSAVHRQRPAGPACAKPLARDEEALKAEEERRMAAYEELCRANQVDDDGSTDDETDLTEGLEECEPAEEPVAPQLVLVADVMDRCIQLLPQSDDELYACLVHAIRLSIDILWISENLFLPKVHLLWEPLKNQLFSPSPLKQRQAFDVLTVIVHRCPDFVRQRVVREALPKLTSFLRDQAGISVGRFSRAHVAAQGYKFQRSVLSEMGDFVEYLDPSAGQVGEIVGAVSLYLDRNQTVELQTLAKSSLKTIASYHREAVRDEIKRWNGRQNQHSTTKRDPTASAANVEDNDLWRLLDT